MRFLRFQISCFPFLTPFSLGTKAARQLAVCALVREGVWVLRAVLRPRPEVSLERISTQSPSSSRGTSVSLIALGTLVIREMARQLEKRQLPLWAASPKAAESNGVWARHRGWCWTLPVGRPQVSASVHAQTSGSCLSLLLFCFAAFLKEKNKKNFHINLIISVPGNFCSGFDCKSWVSGRLIGPFGLQMDRYYFIIIGSGCRERGRMQ